MDAAANSAERLRVTYRLVTGDRRAATDSARAIALEQTVELPADCVAPEIEAEVVGRVERVAPAGEGRWTVSISYAAATVGGEVPQLLNLLFGNISLQRGIRVERVDWPPELLRRFGGPRHGVDGLRRLCGVSRRRPLLCAALKPMGLSPTELAARCHDFALGGIDLIKDDHGLGDQPQAPFDERYPRCQEAVERANARSGGRSLYVPNLTASAPHIGPRAERVRAAGCRAVMLGPLLVGPDCVRWVADSFGLAVLAHPALGGAFFHDDHGIAPEVLLGQVFRVLGGDGVIYPNAGGRFPFDMQTCAAIHEALRAPLGTLRPAFPVPGGGIDVERVPAWLERYGPDTIFLIGGSLYQQRDRVGAARRLRETLEVGG